MATDKEFEKGWLRAELEAAVKEVESWSPGMRRNSAVTDQTSAEAIEPPKVEAPQPDNRE